MFLTRQNGHFLTKLLAFVSKKYIKSAKKLDFFNFLKIHPGAFRGSQIDPEAFPDTQKVFLDTATHPESICEKFLKS